MKNDFRHIRSHTFRKRRYKIRWRKPRDSNPKGKFTRQGLCDPPDFRNPEILINPNAEEKLLLKVLIDESIHGCFWEIDNECVDEASEDISNFLWRVGFRLESKK